MFFGKSARVGNEIDMVLGQVKAKANNVIITLKQSDMIEAQFGNLEEMAKRSGDAQLVMQFGMLRQLMDNMQNTVTAQLNDIVTDLNRIDQITDKIQSGGF
ncbi:TPA: hypothetical protein KOX39_003443 [Clostridioides difficile]|nr:hypothetical protein [Clostridioides difficile]